MHTFFRVQWQKLSMGGWEIHPWSQQCKIFFNQLRSGSNVTANKLPYGCWITVWSKNGQHAWNISCVVPVHTLSFQWFYVQIVNASILQENNQLSFLCSFCIIRDYSNNLLHKMNAVYEQATGEVNGWLKSGSEVYSTHRPAWQDHHDNSGNLLQATKGLN